MRGNVQERGGGCTFKLLVEHGDAAGGPVGSKEAAPEAELRALAVVHGQYAAACGGSVRVRGERFSMQLVV